MSGGHYGRAHRAVEEFVEEMQALIKRAAKPDPIDNWPTYDQTVVEARNAFIEHLKLVATAMHDIEWVDSSDLGDGDELAAIRAVLRATKPKRKRAPSIIKAANSTAPTAIAITTLAKTLPDMAVSAFPDETV